MKMNRELKLCIEERQAIIDKFEAYGDITKYALAKAKKCIRHGNAIRASFYTEIATRCTAERQGCVDDLDIVIKRLEELV